MRAKVIKLFRDKYTKTLHNPNEILEISEERYQEINGTALGILVEEIKEKKSNSKSKKK